MTRPTKPAKQRIITTLSMEMMGVPENEQCMIYEHFETAIAKGIILAVQDSTDTFEAKYVNLSGETVTETRPEEHLETNDAWTKWLAEQRLASKYHVIRVRKEYTATSAALTGDANVFEVIAAMRRDDLIERKQAAERQNDKPATKARTRRKTAQTPSPPVSPKTKKPNPQPVTPTLTGAQNSSTSQASPPSDTGAEPAPTPALSTSPARTSATAND